jgi:prepilin peptidase CpaA
VLLVIGTSHLSVALAVVCIGLALVAALHDIVTRTVPNGLALLLAAAGIAIGVTNGQLSVSILAAGSVFVIAALCWRRGWMGGGDVKLLGATALCVPASSVLTFIAAVAIAGGLLAVIYLAARRYVRAPPPLRPNSLLRRAMRVERRRISRGGPLPYACAIAAGFIFVIV